MRKVYFIERLTPLNWFFQIFPTLVQNRGASVYYIDGSSVTAWVATKMARWVGSYVEKLVFRLVDIKDDAGLLLRMRIAFSDMNEICDEIVHEPLFQNFLKQFKMQGMLPQFLAKSVSSISLTNHQTLWRALLLVHIARWKIMKNGEALKNACLFLEKRPWSANIVKYGAKDGINIRFLVLPFWQNWNFKWEWLRHFYFVFHYIRWHWKHRSLRNLFSPPLAVLPAVSPKVGVEYYGQLNLDDPACHSDLFFFQQSSLKGKDISVLFHIPADPLNAKKWDELKRHGINAAVLHPLASQTASCPPLKRRRFKKKLGKTSSLEVNCLQKASLEYHRLRAHWRDVFDLKQIKVYLLWFRYDSSHSAIADAIKDVGGVMALYQRALDTNPSPGIAAYSDIAFGYSQFSADVEKASQSIIPYYVITGFFADHRFQLVHEKAQNLRQHLMRNGATHILAYLDENSGNDSRWHTGHEFMRVNYTFLLEKVLSETGLGLVIKPKVPVTLRKRLGPVVSLLEKAEATGRCYVYEGGVLNGSSTPSLAGLSADVVIHGHLCAATAGLETALAGVPTLLVDREGWAVSPLYQLGVGKVVFNDWPSLWEVYDRYQQNPASIPGFGDWSSMLDQLDPFRDGRAAERVGTYVKWLIEGFKAKLDRETVMADAAERYCQLWGYDKVLAINSNASFAPKSFQ